MAVKYRRGTLSGGDHHPDNRYEIRPGSTGAPARRRLFFIYVAIAILAIGSLLFHFLSQNRSARWLPERSGPAIVVEKLSSDASGGSRYELRIRVLVPVASPAEAALVPEDTEDRAEILGPRELEDTTPTSYEDWTAVEAGTRLRATYQINIPRTQVMIHELYLDHMDQEGALP